jgi:hypothetical protein
MVSESLQEVVAGRRRWKWTAIGLVAVLAGVLAIRARADLPFPEMVRARTVEAQEIVLKDGSGRLRARLAVKVDAVRLVLYDERGKAVAVLPERARWKELGKSELAPAPNH